MSLAYWTKTREGYKEIINAVSNASECIFYEQFMVGDPETDLVVARFCDEIEKALERNVDVRLLFDSFGSRDFLRSDRCKKLKNLGAEVLPFQTSTFNRLRHGLYPIVVDHRKILIIDNTVYTGGMLLYEDMIEWNDLLIKLEDEAREICLEAFNSAWEHVKNDEKMHPLRHTGFITRELYGLSNRPGLLSREVYEELALNLAHASKSITIVTPYFAPNIRLANTLVHAAKSGVKVQIILPEKSDHTLVDIIARTYFSRLLKAGVEIFYYKDEMLHAKIVLLDDEWVTFGSCNFDYLSFWWNYEFNLATTDKKIIGVCKEAITIYKEKSVLLDTESWKHHQTNHLLLPLVKPLRIFG